MIWITLYYNTIYHIRQELMLNQGMFVSVVNTS